MKLFNFFFLFSALLFAEEIEVTAKQFYADENARRAILTGSVVVTKGKDVLRGEKMIILFTPDRQVSRFESSGGASFSATLEKPDSKYEGEADELVYLPSKGEYTLNGRAWVEDLTNKRKVIGDHIVFNEQTRIAKVSGQDSAPVKLIFTIKDRNDTKP
ncbi:MAG: lipopolysaccharide transport periplasmic protein LptA [Helicobacteraceae bacterium]|jgi:lipopolysaccharide export system protein LptA|nr:lipopolysaccharide transport periplasmic protein LptA [Helicobacteraceae bacterium]